MSVLCSNARARGHLKRSAMGPWALRLQRAVVLGAGSLLGLGVDLSASLQWPFLWDLAVLMEAALANLVIQLVLNAPG